MNCKLCNYSTNIKHNFVRHCQILNHISQEKIYNTCVLCNKKYNSRNSYNNHKRNYHNKKLINTNNNHNNHDNNHNNHDNNHNNHDNNSSNQEIKNEIVKSNIELKDEINKSNEKIVSVVNKAITKASSLIKFLMENHSSTPPLKKINKESIDILRIDYKCPLNPLDKNDYFLQEKLIDQFRKKTFIRNISKSILNLVNYKDPEKQSIYNTDCVRNNYVIKTSAKWNEDKAGIKFTEYVIKPFLNYIKEIITEFRINDIEKRNTQKYKLHENEKYYELYSMTLSLEIALNGEDLINGILKEVSPYLRYLEKEIEELEKLEKYNELEELQEELKEELKEIIHNKHYDSSSDSYSSDSDI